MTNHITGDPTLHLVINRIYSLMESGIKDAIRAGDTRLQARARILAAVSAIYSTSRMMTIAESALDIWLGDDEDWNNQLIKAGYLPIRADERV